MSIGQSIGQKCGVQEGHGFTELLIPSVAAVRILAGHHVTAGKAMPKQSSAYLEWDAEIL